MKSGWKGIWGRGVLVVLSLAAYVPAGTQSGQGEQAKATAAERDVARKPVAVPLRNGVTLELVGVCASPARGLQWWAPDGSPLSNPPYEGWSHPSARQWIREPADNRGYYELALRVTSESNESLSLEWQFTRGSQGWFDMALRPKPDLRNVFVMDMTQGVPMDFRVAVAGGPWKTDCTYPQTHQGSDFTETELAEHAVIWQRPMKPEENRPGKLKLNVIHDYKGDYEVRIIAVDEQGAVHETVQSQRNFAHRLTVWRGYYDLAPEEVREFQLQVRPLYWAEFQNVSLRPGGQTHPVATRKAGPDAP